MSQKLDWFELIPAVEKIVPGKVAQGASPKKPWKEAGAVRAGAVMDDRIPFEERRWVLS